MRQAGFNAVALRERQMDGINRYTANLGFHLNQLYPELTILTSFPEKFDNAFKTPRFLSTPGFRGNVSRLLWDQLVLPGLVRRKRISLYYSPLPEGMIFPACNQIVTVHDILPVIFPDSNPRLKYYYKTILPSVLKSSIRIVAVSESTKSDLIKWYGIPDQKISVIYQGYDNQKFYPRSAGDVEHVKSKFGIKNRYFICVGETRPYKNVEKLLTAFRQVNRQDIQMVVVGKISRLTRDLSEFVQGRDDEERIIFTGHITDDELAGLYTGAEALVFPSLYEGFGVPLLEAMGCGTNVISSKTSSLTEAGADAALYFDAMNTRDMTEKMELFLTNHELRRTLGNRIQEHLIKFSWERTAMQVKEIMKSYL